MQQAFEKEWNEICKTEKEMATKKRKMEDEMATKKQGIMSEIMKGMMEKDAKIAKLDIENRVMKIKMAKMGAELKMRNITIRSIQLPAELLNELFASMPLENAFVLLVKMPNGLLAKNVLKMVNGIKEEMKKNKLNEEDCGPKLAISEEGIVLNHSAGSWAPLDKVCLIGCGVTTGYGAPFNSSIVTPGSNVGVWGLGTIGLAVILGCRDKGAKNIVAVDITEERLKNARKFGATHFLNPKEPPPEGKTLMEYLSKKFDGGLDFTFEASGNTEAMRQAIECTKMGTGETTILGLSAKNLQIPAVTLLLGRTVRGCVVGGYKAKEAVPMLVDKYLDGKLALEEFISWQYSLEEINKGIEHLVKSEGIRSVIKMAE